MRRFRRFTALSLELPGKNLLVYIMAKDRNYGFSEMLLTHSHGFSRLSAYKREDDDLPAQPSAQEISDKINVFLNQ